MASASGRYHIVFNGEVYNYASVREELDRASALPPLRGHSDTEIMLAAFEHWGLEDSIRRFVGMFAFALWDAVEHRLHLVRDRLGIKPLYYGFCGDGLLFGSELRCLEAWPSFSRELDRSAVASLMLLGCVPAPLCIYERVRKLEPGTIAMFAEPTERAKRTIRYWDARALSAAAVAAPLQLTEDEAADQLHSLLLDSVKLRMIADVPLGAFLSGGIDSSTVVALMQAQSSRPVKTFTIGNEDGRYDEGPSAAAIARHLQTDHNSLVVTAAEAQAVVPDLPSMYDEPFADSSQIPTFLVSRLARTQVTVALSGDGGDELFGGYNRHIQGPRLWSALRPIPAALRARAAHALGALAAPREGSAVPGGRPSLSSQRLQRLANLLPASSPSDLHARFRALWSDGERIVPGSTGGQKQAFEAADLRTQLMLEDLVTYLPDDLLTKVDRASMAVALEVRVPVIDHRVVEFSWRLPLRHKVRGSVGKRILRRVLRRYVPDALVDRPKSGFCVPVGEWLRRPLREWAEELLDERHLRDGGWLDATLVRRKWNEHLSGRRDWAQQLWSVLMFHAWLQRRRPS